VAPLAPSSFAGTTIAILLTALLAARRSLRLPRFWSVEDETRPDGAGPHLV
jgi:hypothetical protein